MGDTFGDPYSIPEKTARPVAYASKQELELAIMRRHHVWMRGKRRGAGIPQGGSGERALPQNRTARR